MRFNNRPYTDAQQLTALVAADNDISGFIKDTEGWRVVGASAVAAPITGSLTETTLASVTIPAGAMGPNGILRITTLWSVTNSVNNKTLRVYLGGAGGTLYHNVVFTTSASQRHQVQIHNRNSQSSQVGYTPGGATGGWGPSTSAIQTSAINMALSQTILMRGLLGDVADTITLESYSVELKYGA